MQREIIILINVWGTVIVVSVQGRGCPDFDYGGRITLNELEGHGCLINSVYIGSGLSGLNNEVRIIFINVEDMAAVGFVSGRKCLGY